MAGVFLALLVLGYLIFLIDWRDLRTVLAQGGWAAVGFYAVLIVLLVGVVASPGGGASVIYH